MSCSAIIKDAVPIRKRLFVFCDGTWQDGVNNKQPLTNVATFARCLEGVADDGYLQVVYYDNGVGNATSFSGQIVDGATGRGISDKIRNAYSFLSHNYDFDHGKDEIFLIGYSRGAFTVQCLASFISYTGLLHKRYLYYLRGLFKLWAHHDLTPVYNRRSKPLENQLALHVEMLQAEKLLTKVKIKACVVWDTISNLGIPRPWTRPLSFVGNVVPQAIENAFQALALDETRAQFKPCIWKSKEVGHAYVKQCWFLGSHTDVGGNGDAALGAITLVWMIAQLQAISGVKFSQEELMKHLKHRFLEWDINVNPFLGQFKQTAIWSRRSSSGLSTKSSRLWWLSGFEQRKVNSELVNAELVDASLNATTSIHFTVRLSMVHNRNRCPSLEKWKTRLRDDGCISWERYDKIVIEDLLAGSGYEYTILRNWCDAEPLLQQTDRTRFAARVQALVYDSVEDLEEKLGRFAAFLRDNMTFDQDNHLAPECMYPPQIGKNKTRAVHGKERQND